MTHAETKELENLAETALAGNPTAFGRLAQDVWPIVFSAVRKTASSSVEDQAQELYARLLERLEADDRAVLRKWALWRERHPEKSFLDWLRIVVANLRRDMTRERVGRSRDEGDAPSAKRLLNELGALMPLDGLSFRPPITSAQTAREILDFASKNLGTLQFAALRAWLAGESFAELRDTTGLGTETDAVRLVRAAIATLRRRFAAEPDTK